MFGRLARTSVVTDNGLKLFVRTISKGPDIIRSNAASHPSELFDTGGILWR
jgi:hypothetical protein